MEIIGARHSPWPWDKVARCPMQDGPMVSVLYSCRIALLIHEENVTHIIFFSKIFADKKIIVTFAE